MVMQPPALALRRRVRGLGRKILAALRPDKRGQRLRARLGLGDGQVQQIVRGMDHGVDGVPSSRNVADRDRRLEVVGLQEGYVMILEKTESSILWAPKSMDITDVLIQRYNTGK